MRMTCICTNIYLQWRMTNSTATTTLSRKLSDLSQTPAGFSVSEITGYSPEQVRRIAEAMVKTGHMVRFKVSPRRIRYFANDRIAQQYSSQQTTSLTLAARAGGGSKVKAPWKPDEAGRITSKTKIYIAPPLPRNVYRTNTYLQF